MNVSCPRCNFPLTLDQFRAADKCPSCNHDFVAGSYKSMFALPVLVAIVSGIAYWSSPSDMAKTGAILVTGLTFLWVSTGMAIDYLFLKNSPKSRSQRRSTAMMTSGVITLVISYLIRPYVLGH